MFILMFRINLKTLYCHDSKGTILAHSYLYPRSWFKQCVDTYKEDGQHNTNEKRKREEGTKTTLMLFKLF